MPLRIDITNRPVDPLKLDGLTISPDTHLVHSVVVLPETGSTNDVCRRLAECGVLPTAVVADHQTAGRGRLGRRWFAPPGAGLLLSVSIPHDRLPQGVCTLGLAAPLALVDAILETAGLSAFAKWPNDVLLNGRKTAGILIEDHSGFAVIGMGINVWQTPEDFPPDLRPYATSITAEGGRIAGRAVLLEAVLRHIRRRLYQPPELLLRDRCAVEVTLGRSLIVQAGGRALCGTGVDLKADGSLVIRLPDHTVQRVFAGDVSIRFD